MTKTLVEKLVESAEQTKSIVCFGMDPALENMPDVFKKMGVFPGFSKFFVDIFVEMKQKKISSGAFKPNEGFYIKNDARHAELGSASLRDILNFIRLDFPNTPIILDIKRGDINKSSKNYADHALNLYSPDAVTVNPYMGTDSVEPFLKTGAAYILCRTSNPGAKDLQDLLTITEDKIGELYLPLYLRTAELIAGKWHDISPGNIGAVVGATSVKELHTIAYFFKNSGKQIPLLIPGVGGQGGSAHEVVDCLRSVKYDLRLVRINSSSGITEAWKKGYAPEQFAHASADAIEKLNNEIKFS